jgi:anti-sigma B factor antagonist
MSISAHRDGDVLNIRVSGEMTIYNARELKKGLATHLFAAKDLVMDLTEVSEMDTAGLQLIVLAMKESMSSGGRFKVASLSRPAERIITLFDMSEFLGLSGRTEERQ